VSDEGYDYSIILPNLALHRSPRWLLGKGRVAEAYQSLSQLRNTPLQAARDTYCECSSVLSHSMLMIFVARHLQATRDGRPAC
jgi:hypothetical protein